MGFFSNLFAKQNCAVCGKECGTMHRSKLRDGQFLCGFSMETQNVIDNSRAKLAKKNLDMVAANNVKVEGAGFQGDTNVLTLITQDEEISLPLMSKEDAAFRILDKILSLMQDSVC